MMHLNFLFLHGIFFVAFFFHHAADTVEALTDICKGNVDGRKAETEIIGRAEIGDDVQFFDQGAVDAVSFGVADGDVGAADGRIKRGAEGKAEGRKQVSVRKEA